MDNTRIFVIKVRSILRMTQEEFAYAIGRSPRTVRRWEAGETSGNISDAIAIIKLCKDSGVDLDTIVFFILGPELACFIFFIVLKS